MEKGALQKEIEKGARKWRKELLILTVIALIFTIYCVNYVSHLEQTNVELHTYLTSFIALYGDHSTFVAILMGNTLIPFPTDAYLASAMKLAASPLRVFAIGIIAAFLGGLINYSLAYFLREKWVKKHVDAMTLNQSKRYFDKYGGWALIIFATLPLPLFDPLTFLAGISEMNLKDFLAFTFIAKILHYLLWAVVPYGLL